MNTIPLELQKLMLQGLPINCSYQHPGYGCLEYSIGRFFLTFRKIMAYYLPFHLIPLLLYKRSQLKQRPIPTFFKFLLSYTKSLLFISSMVSVSRLMLCILKNSRNCIDLWTGTLSFGVSGLSLIFESDSRICEITLYLIPRFLETLQGLILRKMPYLKVNQFDLFIFAITIAILHYYYQHDVSLDIYFLQDKTIKEIYKKSLNSFWGVN